MANILYNKSGDPLMVYLKSYQANTTGTPAEGYEIKSITAEPATITIAGSEDGMDSLDILYLIYMADGMIDISDANGTVYRSFKLDRPEYAVYMSDETVILTVEIGAVE